MKFQWVLVIIFTISSFSIPARAKILYFKGTNTPLPGQNGNQAPSAQVVFPRESKSTGPLPCAISGDMTCPEEKGELFEESNLKPKKSADTKPSSKAAESKPIAAKVKNTSSGASAVKPVASSKVGLNVAPEKTKGTEFQSNKNGGKTEFSNPNDFQAEKKNYNAEEIRAFTASGGFRNFEAPLDEAPPLEQELNMQVPGQSAPSGTEGSLYTSDRKEISQDLVTSEKALSHSTKLDSLLLSDDPWVAQMARTTLPAVINQIKDNEKMRESLRERLAALLAKQPNLTEQEEKLAAMMEVALAEAELEDPSTKALADLKSMTIEEAFKLDPEETRSGVDRMIAELEYDAEFLPKQSLFERISTAHRKVQTQKRL